MKKAAVIGSGPAGIFAAWAAIHEGWEVAVFAPEWKQPTPGSAGVFLLHHDLDLPLRHAYVQVCAFGGSADDYRRKVYGDAMPGRTSFEAFHKGGLPPHAHRYFDGQQGIEMVWDILETARKSGALTHKANTIDSLRYLEMACEAHDAVINTAPLSSVLQRPLPSVDAYVHVGSAPADEAYMLYNAHPGIPWYRAAAAFGRFTMEYAEPTPDTVRVRKVVPCPSGVELPRMNNLLLTGRFGAWDKRKLSHHAYEDTVRFLKDLGDA